MSAPPGRTCILLAAIPALLIAVLAGPRVWQEIELHNALQPTTLQPNRPVIVMLGDSHTQIANWPKLTGCDAIANFGVGGNTSEQMLARVPSVVAAAPRAVFVMADDDVADSVDTQANVAKIKSVLGAAGIDVFVQSPPVHASGPLSNGVHPDVVIPFDVSDLLPDGIHLRRSGYAKWRDALAPMIKRYC